MADDIEPILFKAQIIKVQTTVDGAIRLTLDLPETAIDVATKMMQAKQAGAILEIAAVPIEKQQVNNAIPSRSEWKP